jgi:hypothetical protein
MKILATATTNGTATGRVHVPLQVGDVFERLTVLAKAPVNRGGVRYWCLCECGNFACVPACRLRAGRSRSCGCLAVDVRRANHAAKIAEAAASATASIASATREPHVDTAVHPGNSGKKKRAPERQPGQSVEEWFWSRTLRAANGCLEWQNAIHDTGYGVFAIGKKMFRAHRYAWEITNGQIPVGLFVCHRCDNRKCVDPAHLFLGTQMDNMRDMSSKGRSGSVVRPEKLSRGSHRYNAKLSEEAVRFIRAAYAEGGVTQKELGRKYGVPRALITKVINWEAWRHVQ